MPTYEYACQACGHQLEVQQRIIEAALKTCPACGKDQLERLISGTAFILKGGGWYKDGYGSSKAPEKARTENDRGDRLGKAISEDKKKTSGDGGNSGSSDSGSSSGGAGGGSSTPPSTPSSTPSSGGGGSTGGGTGGSTSAAA